MPGKVYLNRTLPAFCFIGIEFRKPGALVLQNYLINSNVTFKLVVEKVFEIN